MAVFWGAFIIRFLSRVGIVQRDTAIRDFCLSVCLFFRLCNAGIVYWVPIGSFCNVGDGQKLKRCPY